MITSGYPFSSATKTEIVDVTNGVGCSDFADFPVKIRGAVAANLQGTPIVCGGQTHSPYSEKCYSFTNGSWEEFTSMNEKRGYAAGVVYNEKLHVFGGYGTYYTLKTSQTIDIDGEVSDGQDLTTAVRYHAMTSINDTVSILSGGLTTIHYSAQTWYYNHESESFSSGPDLMEGRRHHGSATVVDKVTKTKIAVITGGYNGNRLDSTELLINGQWQSGTTQSRD